MSYQTFYRKYRPKVLGDVIGQHMPVRTLKNALLRGEIAHAYLFHGPRGTGKTSVARILARSLNCEKGVGPEPCGVCANCTDILKGLHPEVVEMDAASHSRVEEIRRLLEQLWVPKTRSTYKVYILDEVHMLSSSAFNALLKNVEEPPPGLVFILATTEPHKVPATIRSRCQEYAFGRVAPGDMGPALEAVMEAEGLSAEAGVITEVCRCSEGCMRDALSLLQQLASTSEGPMDLQTLRLLSGRLGEEELAELLDLLRKRDGEALLARFEGWYTSGRSLQTVVQEIRRHVSQLILHGKGAADLAALAGWLDRLDQRLVFERDPMLAVESGLARWVAGEAAPVMARPVAEKREEAARPPAAEEREAARPAPKAAKVSEPAAEFGRGAAKAAPAAGRASGEWEGFVKSLMKKDVPLMAMLSQTQGEWAGDVLTVTFPAKWRLDALDKQGKRGPLEGFAREYFDRDVQLSLVVGGEPAGRAAPLETAKSRAVSAPAPGAAKTPARPQPKAQDSGAPQDEAFIQRTLRLWPGSTVEPPTGAGL